MELQILGNVTLSMVLGALLGFEREPAGKPAGLRTFMFVAGAAALLVGVGQAIVPSFDTATGTIRADPIRLIQAMITGISFLGAGTILRDRGGVEGLTTAASLLMVAILGISVALSLYVVAIGSALLAVFVLNVVKRFERNVLHHDHQAEQDQAHRSPDR